METTFNSPFWKAKQSRAKIRKNPIQFPWKLAIKKWWNPSIRKVWLRNCSNPVRPPMGDANIQIQHFNHRWNIPASWLDPSRAPKRILERGREARREAESGRESGRESGGGGGKRGSSSQEIKTAERWVKPSQYIRIYIRQSWKDSSFQEEGNTHQKNPSGIPRESPENLEGIAEYPNPPGDGEKVERGGVVLERAGLILARRGGRRRGDGWWPLTEDLALLRYFNQSPRNLRSVHTPNPCSSLKDNILIFFSYKHIHTSTSFSVWFEFIWVWSVRFFSFGCYRCFVDCDSAAP